MLIIRYVDVSCWRCARLSAFRLANKHAQRVLLLHYTTQQIHGIYMRAYINMRNVTLSRGTSESCVFIAGVELLVLSAVCVFCVLPRIPFRWHVLALPATLWHL